MENEVRLRKALQCLREEITTPDHVDQAAASALLILAGLLLSFLARARSEAERLEEELLSRGVLLPAESSRPLSVDCETTLVWCREEYLRILETRRRTDGRSSTH